MRWLVPSLVLVMTLCAIGLIAGGLYLESMVRWAIAGVIVWSIALVGAFVVALLKKQPLRAPWQRSVRALPVLAVGGFAMPAYNGIKTLLNNLPMWADPILAKIDLALFGWLYVESLANNGSQFVYFLSWLIALTSTLVAVGMRDPGRERDALILGWFVMWCLLAPAVQATMPSGGPIFYERLGHGGLFADYPFARDTLATADYLWGFYEAKGSGFSSGISAMPSLHVASSAWVVIAWRGRIAEIAAWLYAMTIFVLSVALGWHYALDGIAGAALAWGGVTLARRYLDWRDSRATLVELAL